METTEVVQKEKEIPYHLDDWSLKYNRQPICPHCRKKMSDAWELNLGDGETDTVECGNCGEDFEVEANFDITYHTRPANKA